MPGVSTEEEFRMLYNIIDLSGCKPRMEDLATRMGLKKEATAWRYSKLMKRLKAEFDGPALAQAIGTATSTPKNRGGGCKKALGTNKRQAEVGDSDESDRGDKKKKANKATTVSDTNGTVDGEDNTHEAVSGTEDVAEEAQSWAKEA